MTDDQRKHLEMLQSVISRMAGNSFSIKGWAVALVAVLGGFAAKDADSRFVLALWLPAICFWGLDAFYLRQERLFRALYNAASAPASAVPVFSMDTRPYTANIPGIIGVALSRTILWLHLPVLAFVLALTVYSATRPPAAPVAHCAPVAGQPAASAPGH